MGALCWRGTTSPLHQAHSWCSAACPGLVAALDSLVPSTGQDAGHHSVLLQVPALLSSPLHHCPYHGWCRLSYIMVTSVLIDLASSHHFCSAFPFWFWGHTRHCSGLTPGVVLRNNSWRCLGGPLGCCRWNLGWLCAAQCLLCYRSGPSAGFLLFSYYTPTLWHSRVLLSNCGRAASSLGQNLLVWVCVSGGGVAIPHSIPGGMKGSVSFGHLESPGC